MDLVIKLDEKAGKFFAVVDGRESQLKFRQLDDTRIEFYSTQVPFELRHRGIAHALAEHALHYAQQHQLKVIPSCSFVAAYIERNPTWKDMCA